MSKFNKGLKDKNIVVGITGSIAAYKSAYLVSKLKQQGVNIDVIMTENATKFITPLTFQTLSQNKVHVDMFGWDCPSFSKKKGTVPETAFNYEMAHISLADKADLIIVCPATANIIGKIASGIANDLLSTTIMSTTVPVLFAPAMNEKMYNNKIVQGNIAKLKKSGYKFIEPETGLLACGCYGKGRLADIDKILNVIKLTLTKLEKMLYFKMKKEVNENESNKKRKNEK